MKWIKLILAASLLPLSAGTVTAEEPAAYGLLFDFNSDGTTDEQDWKAFPEWARNYNPLPADGSLVFGQQELPATVNELISSTAPSLPGTGGPDLSSVKEFYLIDGYSTPAKDQNPFGTCWAFTTISSLESNILFHRKGKPVLSEHAQLKFNAEDDSVNLSELYLTLESRTPVRTGPQKSEGALIENSEPQDILNGGGFFYDSQSILTAWDGPLTEEQEPYGPVRNENGKSVYGFHNEAEALVTVPAVHVQTVRYLDTPSVFHADLERSQYVYDGYDPNATNLIKQALTEYGTVAISYEALPFSTEQLSPKAYFNNENYSQYIAYSDLSMNHAVSIVGWNDNYAKENFRGESGIMPEGDGAWLIKNSWGSYNTNKEKYGDMLDKTLNESRGTSEEAQIDYVVNYGVKDEAGHGTGYFWLSYYDHSIIYAAAFDTESAETGFSYDNLYQYDYYREPAFRPIVLPAEGTGIRTANFFTAEKDETLRAVGVFAPVNQADVTVDIYTLPAGSNDLSEGTLAGTASMTLDRGYHTIPLLTAVGLPAGTRFAVSASVSSSDGTRNYSWLTLETGLKESLQTDQNTHNVKSHMVCNEGETMFSRDAGTTWKSPAALNEDPLAGQCFDFGNAMIKAYTTDGIEAAPADLNLPESSPAAEAVPSADPAPASNSAAGILVLVLCGLSAAMVWYFLCRD